VPGTRVTKPSEIDRAVQQAIDFPGPYLLEFRISREECVYPMVVPGTALSEVIPDTPYVPAVAPQPSVESTPSREPVRASGGDER
jgi:hypothetical protein